MLLGVGVAAGFINSVAGAGSLLTLPALMLTGLDANAANATNRLAIFGQALMSSRAYRNAGVRVGGIVLRLLPPALLGSLLGAWAASHTPEPVLRGCIAAALLAMLLLSILPLHVPLVAAPMRATRPSGPMLVGFALIGFYSGFLQIGVGILILLYLVRLHRVDLRSANAIKILINVGTSSAALGVFFWQRLEVDALRGALLTLGSAVGGYWGARTTLRRGEGFVRALMLLAIIACAAKLLWDWVEL